MEDFDEYIHLSTEGETKRDKSVDFLATDGSTPKNKKKKHITINAPPQKTKPKIKPLIKRTKCDRADEHKNPKWMNQYKPLYGPPLISSFLVIDIQKIFRSKFRLPLLNKITRSHGIELLAELLGMYDLDTNFISYWTLDVLSQVIRRCQSISMKEENVKMCILWIHYILLTIHKERPSRRKLFKELCIMFNRAMWQLPEMYVIPHPYHIKKKIAKSRPEKQPPPIPEKKKSFLGEKKQVKYASNVVINREGPKRIRVEEEGGEFEGLEDDLLEEEVEECTEEESSSSSDDEDEEISDEEEEFVTKEDKNKFFSVSSIGAVNHEDIIDEELEYLNDEISELPEEIHLQIHALTDKLTETRETNKRDFFLLIKIIYRTFANRFKFTVIREAFGKPPRPRIIGIGNNIYVPRKVKPRGHRRKVKKKRKKKLKSSSGKKSKSRSMLSLSTKKSPVVEASVVKRFFPSMKKKKRRRKHKKKFKYIRPLAEAVSKRFFEVLADHKYKEVKYGRFLQRMELIKKKLHIKHKNYEKVRDDLKAMIVKLKKKKAAQKGLRGARFIAPKIGQRRIAARN